MSLEPAARPIRKEELPELVQLMGEHARFERACFDAADKIPKLEHLIFDRPARLAVWVVEGPESLLGYAAFSREVSAWRAEEFLHLDCLFLRPEARSRGLGQTLMHGLAAEARRAGLRQIQWQTPIWNQDAARFYERLGGSAAEKLRFAWSLVDLSPEDPSSSGVGRSTASVSKPDSI